MRTESYLAMIMPLVFASPWIVGSLVLWVKRPKDGFVPPSWADLAYRR